MTRSNSEKHVLCSHCLTIITELYWVRTFFRCGKLSFQPRLAEGEAISSSCEIKLNFFSREVGKVWGYSNIITVIWWCIQGKRGRTGNAWNRLHSSINARYGWRLPTLNVMHEPTFLQEWTNEWTKDQFIQVNVSSFLSWLIVIQSTSRSMMC